MKQDMRKAMPCASIQHIDAQKYKASGSNTTNQYVRAIRHGYGVVQLPGLYIVAFAVSRGPQAQILKGRLQ